MSPSLKRVIRLIASLVVLGISLYLIADGINGWRDAVAFVLILVLCVVVIGVGGKISQSRERRRMAAKTSGDQAAAAGSSEVDRSA